MVIGRGRTGGTADQTVGDYGRKWLEIFTNINDKRDRIKLRMSAATKIILSWNNYRSHLIYDANPSLGLSTAGCRSFGHENWWVTRDYDAEELLTNCDVSRTVVSRKTKSTVCGPTDWRRVYRTRLKSDIGSFARGGRSERAVRVWRSNTVKK